MRFLNKIPQFMLIALATANTHAALIQADFRTEAFVDDGYYESPRVYQSTGQVVNEGEYELTSNDLLANDSQLRGGEVWVDYDPVRDTLSLNSQDRGDFTWFSVEITNMVFSGPEQITSLRLITNDLLESPLDPHMTFGPDSLRLDFDASRTDEGYFMFSEGEALFEAERGPLSVPEPGTLSLMIFGIALLLLQAGRSWLPLDPLSRR